MKYTVVTRPAAYKQYKYEEKKHRETAAKRRKRRYSLPLGEHGWRTKFSANLFVRFECTEKAPKRIQSWTRWKMGEKQDEENNNMRKGAHCRTGNTTNITDSCERIGVGDVVHAATQAHADIIQSMNFHDLCNVIPVSSYASSTENANDANESRSSRVGTAGSRLSPIFHFCIISFAYFTSTTRWYGFSIRYWSSCALACSNGFRW